MCWQDHIISDKDILLGKLVIKGTRLSIDHLSDLLKQGWTTEQLLESYPRLTKDNIQAIYAYLETSKTGL